MKISQAIIMIIVGFGLGISTIMGSIQSIIKFSSTKGEMAFVGVSFMILGLGVLLLVDMLKNVKK